MALNRFIDTTLTGPISTVRRQAIAIVVCAASCVGAIFYIAAAASLALEPVIGAVGARLAVGGGFALVAVVALFVPRLFRHRGLVERAQVEAESMSRDEKFALIIEALLAGFSLSSRRSQATSK